MVKCCKGEKTAMRVFVALELPQRTKDNLMRAENQFAQFAIKGNFTSRDNLHLTLHFLGEVAPTDLLFVESCMDNVRNVTAPRLAISQYAVMKASDVVCARFANNKQLLQLHEALGNQLEKRGFTVEHRAFRPHVTLARKYAFTLPFSEVTKSVDVFNKPFDATQLVLYQSQLSPSGATYVELYRVSLPVANQ